jgi:hypothetical protein
MITSTKKLLAQRWKLSENGFENNTNLSHAICQSEKEKHNFSHISEIYDKHSFKSAAID